MTAIDNEVKKIMSKQLRKWDLEESPRDVVRHVNSNGIVCEECEDWDVCRYYLENEQFKNFDPKYCPKKKEK